MQSPLLSVDAARERLLALLPRLARRPHALADAGGLVLAADVLAGRDLPGFDNSAMDGFAVRAADTAGASDAAMVRLRVLGEIAAGASGDAAVAAGTALRIMTGAPLPAGADAIVEVELTAAEGDEVVVRRAVDPGRSVRRAGDDIRRGEIALPTGTVLGPAQLALLAALGEVMPVCIPRPRVAVVATGDELVDPAVVPARGQVTDIVGTALTAAVREAGGEPVTVARAADTEADVKRAFADAAAAGVDLVISVGGVSMGEYDFVRRVIESAGALEFWRVAMRPGRPLAVGTLGALPVVGLPGNPVSALVGFEVYVLPAILALSGRASWARPRARARLLGDLDTPPGMRTFVRARTERADDGALVAAPLAGQGSHQLRSLAAANALLDVPEATSSIRAGAEVDALLLEQRPGPGWSR
jgi:molybdopterin molybdotransferase